MKTIKLNHTDKIIGASCHIGDFWEWAYSDILANTIRPVFAEFIVGAALGVLDTPRIEWNAFDLKYKGKKVEVKSSAYLQSWQQNNNLSPIKFDIAKKRPWNPETGKYSSYEPIHSADIYVFCVYTEQKDKSLEKIRNLSNWEFYVVPTSTLIQSLGIQKHIGLNTLKKIVSPIKHVEIKRQIDRTLLDQIKLL